MWIKVVVLFGCWCLGFCEVFNRSLQSIVGLQGQSVVLPCTPTLNQYTVKWKRLSPNSGHGTVEKILYNGLEVSNPSKYKVGQYDLTVHGLDLKDAGTYKCALYRNGNSTALTIEGISSAELIVVDSDPICSANFTNSTELREEDLVGVTCHVSYLGKAVPVTHCHRTQSNEQLSTNQSSNAGNGTVAINTVTIKVDIDLNGQVLNCMTFFQPTSDPIQESNSATNIPNYRHLWSTPRLNVVFEPRNLRLDPEAEYYYIGTTVRCVADANPPPTLVDTQWHNTGHGQEIDGDQLTIDTPGFSPGTFKYRCTVKNKLGISNTTFTIRVKGEVFSRSLENIVGLRGESVVLPCTPTVNQYTVNWKRLSPNSDNGTSEKILYNGHEVTNTYKYNVGQYDLTVRGLDLGDAGTYKCILLKNGNSQAITIEGISSAELIVVDSDPICSANFTNSTELREKDLVGVTCHVSYLGKAILVTQCHNEQRSTSQSSNAVVVNTVTIKVDIDLNGQMLNCTTYFQPTSDPIQESNSATNIPSYRHLWYTPRLNVVFEPRNLRLDPEAEYYDFGTTVRCVADANPPPTLVETQWHNTGNGQEIDGDQLTIDTPGFSPGTFKYRCTVKNKLGISNTTFTIRVKGEKNGGMMTVYTIGLPVFIVILALVTTTAVLVAKNRTIRKKLKKQEEMREMSTELQLTENNPLSDYDEIIDDSPMALQGPTTDLNPTYLQIDVYNDESEAIPPPKEPNLCYTGLTESRHIPTPSAYTALENSGRPPSPPPRDDSTTTSTTSTTSYTDIMDGSSVQQAKKTPNYVNQPLYIEATAEEA